MVQGSEIKGEISDLSGISPFFVQWESSPCMDIPSDEELFTDFTHSLHISIMLCW